MSEEEVKDSLPDGAEENPGDETFRDLQLDPQTAKELDAFEQKYNVRPDFLHKGQPGFYSRNEAEWWRNMRAIRKRISFRGEKIREFLRKNPGRNFYIRNPNPKQDFMYPVNRKPKNSMR